MSSVSVPQINFAGGEWSPSLAARFDLAKYRTAANLLHNFIVSPEGGASNRPGTRYICDCKYPDRKCRLIPFQYNVEQSYVLEMGHEYFRVIADKALIYDGASPVEVVTDYQEADLPLLKFTQSADVLYIAHPKYPLKKISRYSDTSWTYQTVSIGTSTAAPTGFASAGGGAGAAATYAVTATIGGEESLISNVVTGKDDETYTWSSVFGVDEYNVYRRKNGLFGWVARVAGTITSYTATNIDPDMDSTPPIDENPFDNSNVLTGLSADIIPVQSATSVTATSGGGWTTSTSAYYNNGSLHYAMNDSPAAGNFIEWYNGAATFTADITFNLPSSLQVSGISFTADSADPKTAPKDFKLSGWTGSAWVQLMSVSGESGWAALESRTYTFTNETSYTKYKLEISESTNANHTKRLAQVELFTGTYESAINNPGAIAFHQQRLIPARTDTNPQTFWGSQPGRFSNFNTSVPLRQSDSYEFTISDQQINEIKWLVSYRNNLMIGTSGSEWIAAGSESEGITPTSINVKLESRYGSGDQPAIIIGNSILFVERGNRIVRDFSYSLEADGFSGGDLTLLAGHLFREREILEWAFQRLPFSCLWLVMDDGVLLGLTYDKGQDVWGWHRHTTDGLFESVACIRNL